MHCVRVLTGLANASVKYCNIKPSPALFVLLKSSCLMRHDVSATPVQELHQFAASALSTSHLCFVVAYVTLCSRSGTPKQMYLFSLQIERLSRGPAGGTVDGRSMIRLVRTTRCALSDFTSATCIEGES